MPKVLEHDRGYSLRSRLNCLFCLLGRTHSYYQAN
uniref:Uncharacterized protein n=1 Tax=Arundo donax TaxID=35708 RepID=A0A0A8YVQ4_ARUDO